MKRYLLLACISLLTVLAGCDKEDSPTAVILDSISRETFDYKGGLASAVVNTGGIQATATSDKDWCKVAVFGANVNFNVFSFTGNEDRTAVITVNADGLKPLEINVSQSRFRGLIAAPTSLIFTKTDRTLPVAVISSGDYTVSFLENPGNAFSYEKTEAGVNFTSNKEVGREDISGRAVLKPTEGDEIIVTLSQPKKSNYDYLLGTWTVTNNETGQYPTFTFTVNGEDESYNISVSNDDLDSRNPFVAEFAENKVTIQSGQKMGTKSVGGTTKYVTLHFNGTIDGEGWYIFNGAGRVAWEATPVFNENTGTVKLVFADNGQGGSSVGVAMCLWYSNDDYFKFNDRNVAEFRSLELSKLYE